MKFGIIGAGHIGGTLTRRLREVPVIWVATMTICRAVHLRTDATALDHEFARLA